MSSDTQGNNTNGFFRGLVNAMSRISASSGNSDGMRVKEISGSYSVSPQISVSDVGQIKAMGYKTIMCNRPDDEERGQPSAATIKQAAKAHGMDFYHVPMGRGGASHNTLVDFRKVLKKSDAPVFAYCRSGNRCTILWKASQG